MIDRPGVRAARIPTPDRVHHYVAIGVALVWHASSFAKRIWDFGGRGVILAATFSFDVYLAALPCVGTAAWTRDREECEL